MKNKCKKLMPLSVVIQSAGVSHFCTETTEMCIDMRIK
jgi:hypothetical protein